MENSVSDTVAEKNRNTPHVKRDYSLGLETAKLTVSK